MAQVKLIDLQNHRSRERIRDLGEVFTPEKYVQKMLSMIEDKDWSNDQTVFFEPTCGHGNIVIPIFKRRLDALFKKAQTEGKKNSAFYVVANALNTMWAIDIDSENVENCRARLLVISLNFLKEATGIKSNYILIQKNQDFFAHVLCALRW